MSIVMLEASLGIGGSVPCLDFSTMDSKDISDGFLAFVCGLDQLITDAVTRFDEVVREASTLADSASLMSSPDLLSPLHSTCVEAADLMAIVVLLEEEALATSAVLLSLGAFLLAEGNGFLIVASCFVRSILWVGVAFTTAAAISQGNLVVRRSVVHPVDTSFTVEFRILSNDADSSILISRAWNKDTITVDHEVSVSSGAPWVSGIGVHGHGLSRSKESVGAGVSGVIVPEELHSLLTSVVECDLEKLLPGCGFEVTGLCCDHRHGSILEVVLVIITPLRGLSEVKWFWFEVFVVLSDGDPGLECVGLEEASEGEKASGSNVDLLHL